MTGNPSVTQLSMFCFYNYPSLYRI